MTTIRVDHTQRRYTVVTRETVNDERLSFKARGLLIWLLDKPNDWRIDRDQIATVGPDKVTAIRSALQELRESGYLVQERVQDPDTKQWTTVSTVFECPQCADDPEPDGGKPGHRRADGGKPDHRETHQ